MNVAQIVTLASIIIAAGMMGAGFLLGGRYQAHALAPVLYITDRFTAETVSICRDGTCEQAPPPRQRLAR